jgi:hypothetical protein
LILSGTGSKVNFFYTCFFTIFSMLRYLIIALGCLGLSKALAQPNCELKRDADGIKVYTCKTDTLKFKSLRAEFELSNATIQQLKDFLWDVSNYPTWQYNLMEAQEISSPGKTELAYRALVDAPWPVENRETIVSMRVIEMDTILTIHVSRIDYKKPPPDNVIRVPYFEASWKVTPAGRNLKAVYTLHIDPGGIVPVWLVNIAMADGPYVSFKNLKAQLEKKGK